MSRSFRLTSGAWAAFTFASLCSTSLLAQEDDLEIPAGPPAAPAPPPAEPAPPAAPEAPEAPAPAPPADAEPAKPEPAKPAPAPSPAPTPPAAAPEPAAAAAAAGTAEVEPSPPKNSPAPSGAGSEKQAAPKPALSTGNLERTAHSRPVPLGLLFSGFVQGEYQRNQISEDQLQQDGAPLNRDQFVLRSARLRLDGGYEFTAYTFELDATTLDGPRIGIRRAEGTVLYRGPNEDRIPPLVGLSLGVTDVPFGYELVESSRQRVFMERTPASEALFPTQTDVGVKAFGAAGFLRYALAFVNGEPVDPRYFSRDPNAAKDLVGRFGADVRVGDGFGVSGGASFSFGKGFHPETVATKDTLVWNDLNNDNQVQQDEIFGQPGTAARPSKNFDRWAIGLDLQLQLRTPIGATQLFAEGYLASNHDRSLFVADPIDAGADVRQLGWYVGLTQEITRYGVAGFRVAYYDPNSDLLESRRGNIVPLSESVLTLSPVIGLVLPDRARLLVQYDFVRDDFARDAVGVPTDAENDQLTVRLQVDL